jgi:ABC-2 type transport system permease protein
VVLVLPLIVQALPASISDAVARYLPANIGQVLFSTTGAPDRLGPAFSPWGGFAILVGYTVVILAVGCWVLVHRDA